jgi:hypothetical protein
MAISEREIIIDWNWCLNAFGKKSSLQWLSYFHNTSTTLAIIHWFSFHSFVAKYFFGCFSANKFVFCLAFYKILGHESLCWPLHCDISQWQARNGKVLLPNGWYFVEIVGLHMHQSRVSICRRIGRKNTRSIKIISYSNQINRKKIFESCLFYASINEFSFLSSIPLYITMKT